MRKFKELLLNKNKIMIWLLSVSSILSISWLGDLIAGGEMFVWLTDIVYKLIPPLHPFVIGTTGWFMGVILLSLMSLVLTHRLYQQGQSWFRPITSLNLANSDPARALIVNVSTNSFMLASATEGDTKLVFIDEIKKQQIAFKPTSLDVDYENIKKTGIWWNWLPILGSIKENNTPQLKHVVFVYTDGKGSIIKKGDLDKWIKQYSELQAVTFHDFKLDTKEENIENLYAQYCTCIEQLEKKGIDSQDIVVDVTGGTTVMSVAASMATLHKKSKFEHQSQTDGKLYKYNLTIQRQLD